MPSAEEAKERREEEAKAASHLEQATGILPGVSKQVCVRAWAPCSSRHTQGWLEGRREKGERTNERGRNY